MAATATKVPTLADVREWALDKNLGVGARGRIGKNVVEAYNKAHRRNPFVEDGTLTPVAESRGRNGHDINVPIRLERSEGPDGEEYFTAYISGKIRFAVPPGM